MKTKQTASVIFKQFTMLTLLAFGAVSCSQKEAAAEARPPTPAEKALDELLLGAWSVSNPLVPHTYYAITSSAGRRTLTVEEGGRTVASHQFEVSAPDSIEIVGATSGQRRGAEFTAKEMKDIIQLKSPPKRLTFSKTAPPQLSSRQRGGTIFVSGIFEGVPVPMDKIAETQRVDLPFDVVGDFDIKLPNTQIRFTEDGPWGDPSKMAFDQPGHPTGKIKMLKVAGVQIVLEGPELHDGLLKTKDHGEIEFVMSGPGRVQPRATLTQIRKMREWLDVEADPEEIASAKRLKDMEESFRTKQHVDQYFRTNTANLDPIEGYWIQAAKHRNYDGTNFNCFIIRTDNNHFMEGSIVERDKVRFYTSSACQIVKTGQIYRYLPSSLSIESGHTEEHSSFQIANGVFSYTSGDAFQPDAGVGVTTHRFYRAEAGLRESTK